MSRVQNQADFIAKANIVHNGKYDYSLVNYTKSSEKIQIICPYHGTFWQTPNKHLAGQGCKICGREKIRCSIDDFIARARCVHGDKYDYSKVEYKSTHEKVIIICPEHGAFNQTPHAHIINQQCCPKCAAIEGGSKRTGCKNVAHRLSVKQAKQQTCLKKYGTKTWAESNEGRNKLSNIISSDDVQNRSKETCRIRYGTDFWTQSINGKEKMHEIMSSAEMKQRVINGYEDKYGVEHYMKTDAGREIAKQNMSTDIRRNATKNGMLKKYGVPYASMVPEIQQKIVNNGWKTKRLHGTFNTSKPEETLYSLLCDMFGTDDVVRQYQDERYPFHCDFYIKSLDTFIELNASWTHGGHWFDENNEQDVVQLEEWQKRSSQKGSRYYHQAIDVWTRRDLEKRQCAENNNLNYIVFWKHDLSDARAWILSMREEKSSVMK